MRNIRTIFVKELRDILRDRRTLMTMIFVPLFVYPLLMFVFTKVNSSQNEKNMAKELKVAVIHGEQAKTLRDDIDAADRMAITALPPEVETAIDEGADQAMVDSLISQAIRDEKVDIVLLIAPHFQASLDSNRPGHIRFYFNATSSDIIRERIRSKLDLYEQIILKERFAAAGVDESFKDGLEVASINAATERQIFGKLIGGILPYFFIIISFTASMYPAIDLAAGEKERSTLETILTSPASRFEIILGKIGVVMLAGFLSAIIALVGIGASLQLLEEIPDAILDILTSLLTAQTAVLLLLMILPLSALFASILLSFSIYARSYKEAQSMITPMLILIIFPAFIGMMPGMELNATTALIPILNVSLASKDILAGTLNPLYYAITLCSLIVLAGAGVLFSVKWFGRESVLLR